VKRVLFVVFILAAVFISGCTNTPPNGNSSSNDNSTGLELIEISEEIVISQELCSERGLQDKVIVMESMYCGACKVAVPRLQEIEQELEASFIYLDLSKPEDLERMKSFGVVPRYTPTTLVGCRVMIGAYSKEQFKQVIEPFWNSL
jgi:thiol-disulfide isomerase/thioredoxin